MSTTREQNKRDYKIFQKDMAVLAGSEVGNETAAVAEIPALLESLSPLFQGPSSLPTYVKAAHLRNVMKYVFDNNATDQFKKFFTPPFFDRLLYFDKNKRIASKRQERAFQRLDEIFGYSHENAELSILQKTLYKHIYKRAQEEERDEEQNKMLKDHKVSSHARALLKHVQGIFKIKYAGTNDTPLDESSFSEIMDRDALIAAHHLVEEKAQLPTQSRQMNEVDYVVREQKQKIHKLISAAGYIKYIRLDKTPEGQEILKRFTPEEYLPKLMMNIVPLLSAELPSYMTQKDMQDILAFHGYKYAASILSTEAGPFIVDRLVKGNPDADEDALHRCFGFINEISQWIDKKEQELSRINEENERNHRIMLTETKAQQIAREQAQGRKFIQQRIEVAFNLKDDILKAKVLGYMVGAKLMEFHASLPIDDARRQNFEGRDTPSILDKQLEVWNLELGKAQTADFHLPALLKKIPSIQSPELKKFIRENMPLEKYRILNDELYQNIFPELNKIVEKGVRNFAIQLAHPEQKIDAISMLKKDLNEAFKKIGISSVSDSDLDQLAKNIAHLELYRRTLHPLIRKFLPQDISIGGTERLFSSEGISTYEKIQQINNLIREMENKYAEPSLTKEELPEFYDQCASKLQSSLELIGIQFRFTEVRHKILPTILMDFDRRMGEDLSTERGEEKQDNTKQRKASYSNSTTTGNHFRMYKSKDEQSVARKESDPNSKAATDKVHKHSLR